MALTAPERTREPALEARAWLRTVGRRGPERWVWWVAAAGWIVLLAVALGWQPLLGGQSGMAMDHSMSHDAGGGATHWWDGMAHHLFLWVAMVSATMLPLIASNLRSVGNRSPRGRRTRATLDVAAGWALVWLTAGVVFTVAALAAMAATSAALTIAVVGAIAVAWQFTSFKQVAVARCHRTLAPPLGRQAGAACRRFGVALGRDCLTTCWPGMLLMTVAAHQLLVVVPVAWLSWRDTRRPHHRPGTRTSVLVLVVVVLVALALSAASG